MRPLSEYDAKRDFDRTSEPPGQHGVAGLAPRFSFQKHDATRLHWDLRLEHDGVLLSWAVTRGPSLDPKDKRLAVRTEDHPLDYLTYEGVIPAGNYGAGTVMLWDLGWWQPFHDVEDGLASGHLHFALLGQRTTGKWSLIRMKGTRTGDKGRENWLLIKEDDEAANREALTEVHDTGILTGRSLGAIAKDGPSVAIWPVRKKTPPKFHPPQLAELHSSPPDDADWWHEVKLDGYRAQIALGKGGARIYTRNGLDWTEKFPPLLPALNRLDVQTALIDGEIVAGAGLERFGDVARAIEHKGPFLFYAFDLLSLDGRDLTPLPLEQRRTALEMLFSTVTPRGFLRLSPVLEGSSDALFAAIGAAGGEGLVSKLRSAPYRSGRSAAWIKSKVERRAAFVIVGFQHSTARGRSFSSLLLAEHHDGALVYRGKVGTGFGGGTEAALRDAMAPLARQTPALNPAPTLRAKVTWLEPSLIAEIRYAEITRDGQLRHASFVALREDKLVTQTSSNDPGTRPRVAGVGISTPERLVYPSPPVTKLQVAEYYEAISDRLLVVARNRPLSLLRLPDGLDGQQFFQKHKGKGFPAAMRQIDLPDAKGQMQDKMYLTSAASILAAVQMGTLEFHIEGVQTDKPDTPDRMIFDLDPDEGLDFAPVRDAAFLIRDILRDCGLPSWPMVTGGKGIHVTVPLRRTASTQSVSLFARTFANLLAEGHPKTFTAKMSKAERKGRIFVDWLRNDKGSTAVAPFSLRARPGAPVAVPVAWDELRNLRGAHVFGMTEALERDWKPIGQIKAGTVSDRTAKAMLEALSVPPEKRGR
jgi:bifunctional non-homologous end joining protein LigD